MTQGIDRSSFEKILGEKVTSLSISKGSKSSDGVAGSLKTVTITTASGQTHTVVVKLLPKDPGMLSYIVNCRVMGVENEFYGSILPDLKQTLQEHNLDADPLLPFPKYYDGSDCHLILEDLRPKGFKMADKFLGLNFKQVSLVLTAISRFHAISYYHIRQHGEKIFQSKDVRTYMLHFPFNAKGMNPKYYKDSIHYYQPMVEIMKKHNEDLGLKMEKLTPQFLKLFKAVYDKTDKECFPVICHGDLWMNNVLFRAENSAESVDDPVELKFIDLQQAHRGNIFEDLFYFFLTSTTPAYRREHLMQSLEVYYRGFTKMLEDLKCPLPIGFSRGFLVEQFFRSLKTMTVFAGAAISFQLISTAFGGGDSKEEEEAVKIEEEVVEDRIVVEKVDPKDLIPCGSDFPQLGEFCRNSILSEQRALDRFYAVIAEMDELGVFRDDYVQ